MDCKSCIDKCHSGCCGVIPFDRKFVKKHKPLRPVIKELEIDKDTVVLETPGFICPYLNEDFSCSVYEDRPEVCRLYGNETQINLTCQYMDKDGRIRSRQERRMVEQKIGKFMGRYIKASNDRGDK